MGVTSGSHFDVYLNVTDNSGHDLVVAPGTNLKLAITNIIVTNADATVASLITFRSGGTTTKLAQYVKAVGGGFVLSGSVENPLFYCTPNAKLDVICGTTSADMHIFVCGYKTSA